jgi:hypothetical protein
MILVGYTHGLRFSELIVLMAQSGHSEVADQCPLLG